MEKPKKTPESDTTTTPELDRIYYERFLADMRANGTPEDVQAGLEGLKDQIKEATDAGTSLDITIEGRGAFTERDREQLSAYRILAEELGYRIGAFDLHGTRAVAPVERVQQKTPKQASELDPQIIAEAKGLLLSVESGVPAFISKKAETILKAYGISDEDIRSKTPDELFKLLRNKIVPTKNVQSQPASTSPIVSAKQPIPTEEQVPSPVPRVMGPEVRLIEDFQKTFNIRSENLLSIEGFADLSPGQRALVLENLKQITAGRIQEEAGAAFKKEATHSKFLGRIWKNVFKKYYIAQEEKTAAETLKNGGIEAHGEIVKRLTQITKDSGIDAKIRDDGTLEIQYIGNLENLNDEQKQHVQEFNTVATKLSAIPYEWSLPSASEKEWEAYNNADSEYRQARKNILNIKKTQLGNDGQAALDVLRIDKNILSNQFLNTHPDVEKRLEEISSDSAWVAALKNIATERGVYMGAGYVTRAITTSLLGGIAVPLAAAGMGAYMARKRAVESLKEQEKLARRGVADASAEKKDFVGAPALIEKIQSLLRNIEAESDDEKKKDLHGKLNARLYYTQAKINDGLVNFGSIENRLGLQYELLQTLSSGEAVLASGDAHIKNGLKARLADFLSMREEEVTSAQNAYIRKQMAYGAVMGGTFATLGYAIRDYFTGGTPAAAGGDPAKLSTTPHLEFKNGIPTEASVSKFIRWYSEQGGTKQETPAIIEHAKQTEIESQLLDERVNEIKEAAVIHKGEGIEHAFIRQIKLHPEEFGFKGDAHDLKTLEQFANTKAHQIALQNGYVKAEGYLVTEETRVAKPETSLYVLHPDDKGGATVEAINKSEYIYDENAEMTKKRLMTEEELEGGKPSSEESHLPEPEVPEAEKGADTAKEAIEKLSTNLNIPSQAFEGFEDAIAKLSADDREALRLILLWQDNPIDRWDPSSRHNLIETTINQILTGDAADRKKILADFVEMRRHSADYSPKTGRYYDESEDRAYQRLKGLLFDLDEDEAAQPPTSKISEPEPAMPTEPTPAKTGLSNEEDVAWGQTLQRFQEAKIPKGYFVEIQPKELAHMSRENILNIIATAQNAEIEHLDKAQRAALDLASRDLGLSSLGSTIEDAETRANYLTSTLDIFRSKDPARLEQWIEGGYRSMLESDLKRGDSIVDGKPLTQAYIDAHVKELRVNLLHEKELPTPTGKTPLTEALVATPTLAPEQMKIINSASEAIVKDMENYDKQIAQTEQNLKTVQNPSLRQSLENQKWLLHVKRQGLEEVVRHPEKYGKINLSDKTVVFEGMYKVTPRPGDVTGIKEFDKPFRFVVKLPESMPIAQEIPAPTGKTSVLLENIVGRTDQPLGIKAISLATQLQNQSIAPEDFTRYYAEKTAGGKNASETILRQLRETIAKTKNGTPQERDMAQRALTGITQRLLTDIVASKK